MNSTPYPSFSNGGAVTVSRTDACSDSGTDVCTDSGAINRLEMSFLVESVTLVLSLGSCRHRRRSESGKPPSHTLVYFARSRGRRTSGPHSSYRLAADRRFVIGVSRVTALQTVADLLRPQFTTRVLVTEVAKSARLSSTLRGRCRSRRRETALPSRRSRFSVCLDFPTAVYDAKRDNGRTFVTDYGPFRRRSTTERSRVFVGLRARCDPWTVLAPMRAEIRVRLLSAQQITRSHILSCRT